MAEERHGMRAGPNCLGYVNYAQNICITFSIAEPHPVGGSGIAVVSQSGAMATVVQRGPAQP